MKRFGIDDLIGMALILVIGLIVFAEATTPYRAGGTLQPGQRPDEELMSQTPLIQYGLTPVAVGTQTVTLPVAYADSNYSVTVQAKWDGALSTNVPDVEISNNNQFKIRIGSITQQWYWIAVGKRPARRTR